MHPRTCYWLLGWIPPTCNHIFKFIIDLSRRKSSWNWIISLNYVQKGNIMGHTMFFIERGLCWKPLLAISLSIAFILLAASTCDSILLSSYGAFTVLNNENRSSYVLISGKSFICLILANTRTARSGWFCKIWIDIIYKPLYVP